ncbi:Histone acetyltransferase RTT109 [Yarrowia sp. B02]|nr:Histone acetyltransferase RTT109 [Yarrowia sp. B02]
MSVETSLVDEQFVKALEKVLPKLPGDFVFHHYHTKKRQCKRSLIFQDDILDGFDEDDEDEVKEDEKEGDKEDASEAADSSEKPADSTESKDESTTETTEIKDTTEEKAEEVDSEKNAETEKSSEAADASESKEEPATESKTDAKPAKVVPPEILERRKKHTVTTHMFVLSYEKTILFALEIYTFYDPTGVTLFVSKADTTGQSPLVDGESVRVSMKDVSRAIIDVLLKQHPGQRVRICLFARPEKQYLFPFSADYPKKHFLSGPQLTKWWMSCLDGVLDDFENPTATLRIPGAETRTVQSFLEGLDRWTMGDIFKYQKPEVGEVPESDSNLAIYQLPRFPDDPKSRFLDFLATEGRTTTCSIDMFWEEIQGRQEFNAGIMVGLMGVDGTVKGDKLPETDPASSLSYKEFKNVREIITESDYTTTELVIDANRELTEDGPAQSRVSFKGQLERAAPAVSELKRPVVNTLNMNLVRKKKKTN